MTGDHTACMGNTANAGILSTTGIGVFRSRRNADALLVKLLEIDPEGRVHPGRGFYHVVTRLFATEAKAVDFRKTLKAEGFSTYVRVWVTPH